MSVGIPDEVVEAIERLGAQCQGDVPALVAETRSIAPIPFSDDTVLARAIEHAAMRRAAASDRGAAWWLACAVAMLRASPIASAQEEAEVVAARVLGELSRSPAAVGALPEGARWLVAGASDPPPIAPTIELARKNATTYVERLDAELSGRTPMLRAKWEAAPNDGTRAAIDEALSSYANASASTRAALSRVADHVYGRTSDPNLAQLGAAALAELDDVVLPSLRARIAEARAAFGGRVSGGVTGGQSAPVAPDRPSFAGAAPPAFHPGTSASHQAPAEPPPPPDAPRSFEGGASSIEGGAPMARGPRSIEELDAAMRSAFERAWASPDPEARAAFEYAVRERYERETAQIPDPEARKQALDHYVAHALAQLPARS